jgi:hypothetical protein
MISPSGSEDKSGARSFLKLVTIRRQFVSLSRFTAHARFKNSLSIQQSTLRRSSALQIFAVVAPEFT